MKDLALRHLMLAAARSARVLVEVDEQRRIDAAASSLQVVSQRPAGSAASSYELRWLDNDGGAQVLQVSAQRFNFYARGDVASVVSRRPGTTDNRTKNWLEAHRVWGEIAGVETLSKADSTPALSIPLEIQPGESLSGKVPHVLSTVLSIAALGSRLPIPRPASTLLTGVVAGAFSHRSSGRKASGEFAADALLASTAAVVAQLVFRPSRASAQIGLAGGALLFGVGHLVDGRPGGPSIGGSAAALASAAVAWSGASFEHRLAAGLLVAADAGAAWLRAEPLRLQRVVRTGVLVSVAGTGLSQVGRRVPEVGAGGVSAASLTVSSVLALTSVFTATHGRHDRLSTPLTPFAVAVASIRAAGRDRSGSVLAASTLAAGLAQHFRTTRIRAGVGSPVAEGVSSVRDAGASPVPVQIRSRSA